MWMHPANERWHYNVTSPLIGWAHDPCVCICVYNLDHEFIRLIQWYHTWCLEHVIFFKKCHFSCWETLSSVDKILMLSHILLPYSRALVAILNHSTMVTQNYASMVLININSGSQLHEEVLRCCLDPKESVLSMQLLWKYASYNWLSCIWKLLFFIISRTF